MESIWNRKDWHEILLRKKVDQLIGGDVMGVHFKTCTQFVNLHEKVLMIASLPWFFFPNPLQNKVRNLRTEGAMKETKTKMIFQMQKKILEPYYDTQPPLTTPQKLNHENMSAWMYMIRLHVFPN